MPSLIGPSKRCLLSFVAMWAASPCPLQAADSSKPNIIVIITDDQGYADLGAQGVVKDILTPNLDALAASGARCTDGYITAPQCSPSRAGLLTGRYQQRFGLDQNTDSPLPLEELTIAERLRPAGYISGMVGKWHLDPNWTSQKWMTSHLPDMVGKKPGEVQIPESARLAYSPAGQGFDEFFQGEMNRYWANFGLDGKSLKEPGQWLDFKNQYRTHLKTDAALAFIGRNKTRPFFLYLAYMSPHTPLEAPQKYLERFPGPMPERRRYALAMLSAIDDGVGRIMEKLKEEGLADNTLIFYTTDNGAPLARTKPDTLPVTAEPGGWCGSLNDPWVGEKGMLTEGGIRVPFLVSWKKELPAGVVYREPVSALDIAATALAAAGLPHDDKLDGVNLIPYLSGKVAGPPHAALFWRFWNQAAIRSGKWKYIILGQDEEFLFDLSTHEHEKRNRIRDEPTLASELKERLSKWAAELTPPGLPSAPANYQERPWYEHHLGLPSPPPKNNQQGAGEDGANLGAPKGSIH